MNLIQTLKRCEVFVGLDDSDIQNMASLSSWHMETYNAGKSIFREGAVSKDFYILEDGEISLTVASYEEGKGEPREIPVDTITKGDVFGWSSLLAPHSRNMSAICIRHSTVFVVNGTELNALMDSNQALGYEIMKSLVRVIGRRLRDLQGKFASKRKLPSQNQAHLK